MTLKERKKQIIIGAIVASAVITIIITLTVVFTGKNDDKDMIERIDDKKIDKAFPHISVLEIPNFHDIYRDGRQLRETMHHETLKFFQGSASWHNVTFPFKSNEWKKKLAKNLKKPGVYEWSVSPPCHTKIFSIYRGYSANLGNRFKQYIHSDGIYPKGEELKTLYFKELAARGFKFRLRFRSTDRGAQYALKEEEHGPKGGLKYVDYPFNHEKNGGYRQPFFQLGNGVKLVKDFPIWPLTTEEEEMCAKAA